MKKQNKPIINQVILATTVSLLTFIVAVVFLYLQTSVWLKNQQTENMTRARYQVESLLRHVNDSAQLMRHLTGAPCSAQTISELRRFLAITPNVGNIELTSSGTVYCSSLQGVVSQGTETRAKKSLYMSSDITSLPGHPFILLHIQNGKFGLYTSTDGYYIRSILDSASQYTPVILSTENGWMSKSGVIYRTPIKKQGTLEIRSNDYDFSILSNITPNDVIAVGIANAQLIGLVIVGLSVLAGIATFIWLGRPRTPEKLLLSAIKNHELHPYLQPIVKGDPPLPVGCEVLLRWIHKNEIIPPDQFIPLAEQSGYIIPITQQLVKDVTDQFASTFSHRHPFYISFNISPIHLQSEFIRSDFEYIMNKKDKNISIILEITEKGILSNKNIVNENIDTLKKWGIKFALDDFGTGYSTLETLQRTSVELIKIDKLFTAGIANNKICREIIGNITDLAKRIGADIIAEGVESQVQVAFLAQQSKMAYQGYLYSEPLPIEDFKRWMDAYHSWPAVPGPHSTEDNVDARESS